MPATSPKQKRFMDAAAHNPAFAKKAGVPVSVAKDFSEASKGMKFRKTDSRPEQQGLNKPKTNHGSQALFARGGEMKESKAMEMRHAAAMKKAGVPKKMVAEEMAEARGMKSGGKAKRMAFGGSAEMTSRERAAQMSGRAMPTGKPATTGLAKAAEMSGRTMPSTGRPAMKKGGGVKKMAVGGMTAPAGMPAQANFGGAAQGLDRAAAMSGRTMPAPSGVPAVMPTVGNAAMARLAMPSQAQVPMKKGGKTACYAKGGGIEVKGKTRGKIC